MEQNTIAWLCLLGAGLYQSAWTYSLKFMRITDVKELQWTTFYQLNGGLLVIGPWVGYILFGILNSVLLSIAMRSIATSVAFAIWMALSLVSIKLIDVFWLKQSSSHAELFFIGLITIGIIGLKLSV